MAKRPNNSDVPPCQCTEPGWCPRHQFRKHPHLFALCRERANYRRLWDRRAAAARGPCRHFGAESRRQSCPSCRGHVELKIFVCAVHGECTPVRAVETIACCTGCGDYEPVPKENP